jgi:hypothetical protein
MENSKTTSLKARRESIWQRKDELVELGVAFPSPFRQSKELATMSEEDIDALFLQLPDALSGEVSDESVQVIAGLTPRVAKDGTSYTTAELVLTDIGMSGTNFTFDYKGMLVSVSQDSQLILAHRMSPLTIGSTFHFNVTSGIAPFVKSGSRYFANSSAEYPNNGRLNKSLHADIFQSILDKRQEAKALKKAGVVEIALATNQSIGFVNGLVKKTEKSSAQSKVEELLKSLAGS